MQFMIAPSARLRPSPFFDATVAEGMKALTTYNHMLMPTSFGRPEEEYWRLIREVSMWDVACERQVELIASTATLTNLIDMWQARGDFSFDRIPGLRPVNPIRKTSGGLN